MILAWGQQGFHHSALSISSPPISHSPAGASMKDADTSGRLDHCPSGLNRRDFLSFFSGLGLGGTLFPGVLWARMQEDRVITAEVLANAEKIAGLDFTDEEREAMLRGLNQNLEAYKALREHPIPNEVPPALHFDPSVPGSRLPTEQEPMRRTRHPDVNAPARLEDVAFWPVTKLSELIRSRQVSSVDLTTMYLDRLKRHGPALECVVTLTEELAMEQARRADEKLATGRYRSPLPRHRTDPHRASGRVPPGSAAHHPERRGGCRLRRADPERTGRSPGAAGLRRMAQLLP